MFFICAHVAVYASLLCFPAVRVCACLVTALDDADPVRELFVRCCGGVARCICSAVAHARWNMCRFHVYGDHISLMFPTWFHAPAHTCSDMGMGVVCKGFGDRTGV